MAGEKENPEEVRDVKADKTDAEVTQDRTEFFIGELARMEELNVRRYASLALRMNRLEQKGKTSDDDPTKMFGSIMFVLIGLQVLPVIIDLLVKKWGSSSSLPLSE